MSSPSPELDLPAYAAAVQETVLSLRDEALVLSSLDQHVLLSWWDAGLPLRTLLPELWRVGSRLKARKRPPRGLPLRSLDKAVRKAVGRVQQRSVGAPHREPTAETVNLGAVGSPAGSEGPGIDGLTHAGGGDGDGDDAAGIPSLAPHVVSRAWKDLLVKLRAEAATRPACDPTTECLRAALHDAPEETDDPVSALLRCSKAYYDAAFARWPRAEQLLADQAIDDLHRAAFRRMDPSAAAEVRDELRRRAVQRVDPVLDPERRIQEVLGV